MAIQTTEERAAATTSGFVYVTIGLVGLLLAVGLLVTRPMGPTLAVLVLAVLLAIWCLGGLYMLQPNQAAILLLFGSYRGTDRERGLRWANPFYSKSKISVRAHNFNSEKLKVNDLRGNPIEIAATVVWRVDDTARASFDVENYEAYVLTQAESAVRHLALSYAYDNLEDPGATSNTEVTLRSGTDEVSAALSRELQQRFEQAGLVVVDAKLTHLAYAPEIAGTMLRRQQAEAVIAARTKIVQGAVGMVELALKGLAERDLIQLDDE
ncbi:MAG TPA: SPFH domain-containing protein, partial [Caldimonas sp.]